jgi:hypothetical protein
MKILETINLKKDSLVFWFSLILIIFFIKFIIFCLDPLPMFFLGDSACYLTTALSGWIPPDRSFVYGFMIKLVAVAAHSLTSLLILQIFTSGVNAIATAYILKKFFSVNSKLAFFCGLLCAIEPLQLMYERYIMTEALSLFLFVIFFVAILHYLKNPRLIFLVLIALVGTALISFRLSYLPIVLLNAILLPLLILPSLSQKYSVKLRPIKNLFQRINALRPILGTVILHIIVSIGLTYTLHYGYKSLNGNLSDRPPAYQYQDGIFLLTYLGPVVEPIDFPQPDLRDIVFNDLKYNLKERLQRAENHWQPGGLISNLNSAIPDIVEANHLAKETAFNALKRDPIGIFKLAVSGFLDYWNIDLLRACMLNDRGERPLPKDMLKSLRDSFNLWADDLPFLNTFTNKYFFKARVWYLFLLCLPIICILTFFVYDREKRRLILMIFIASFMIVSISSLMIDGPTVRYLQPLGWLSFLVIGSLMDQILNRFKLNRRNI